MGRELAVVCPLSFCAWFHPHCKGPPGALTTPKAAVPWTPPGFRAVYQTQSLPLGGWPRGDTHVALESVRCLGKEFPGPSTVSRRRVRDSSWAWPIDLKDPLPHGGGLSRERGSRTSGCGTPLLEPESHTGKVLSPVLTIIHIPYTPPPCPWQSDHQQNRSIYLLVLKS